MNIWSVTSLVDLLSLGVYISQTVRDLGYEWPAGVGGMSCLLNADGLVFEAGKRNT